MLLQKRQQWKKSALQNVPFQTGIVLNMMQIVWENMQISERRR